SVTGATNNVVLLTNGRYSLDGQFVTISEIPQNRILRDMKRTSRFTRPSLSASFTCRLWIAAHRVRVIVWIGAEWSQAALGSRQTDHRERSSFMFAVEWRRLRYIEAAGCSVLRVVEPESDVEGVGRSKSDVGIEAEDLIQKNRLDANVTVVIVLPDLNIRLVPGESKAAFKDVLESGVAGAVCEEGAALDGE